jgi:RHS repeat-associated protein
VTVTNYIWDVENDTCLMETDENGATKAVYSHEPAQFGGLISQRRDGQTYYRHYDALGSTRQLTDADENVTDEYVYTAWGEPVVASGTTENPYRWNGRWGYFWDEATGTYYVRRRDYQPTIARWLTVDPLQHLLEFAAYAYVANRSLASVDASGLQQIVIIVLPELPWDPAWERAQWEEYIKAGGIPPGHGEWERPPDYPEGPFPPTTPADPIAWGEELGDETHYPKDEEADDKMGSCVCQDPTKKESIMRPRGSKGDYPIPGRGEVECEVGKKVTMRYKGRCVPKDSPPFPKDCGECEAQTCSRYVVWICDKERVTDRNPSGTLWVVDRTFRRTKCS